MKLTEAKSNLSRLMSEENLIIEQRSGIPSAYFDTENRLLVVPELKAKTSSNVIDLMLSHEVGHALYTPSDRWMEVVNEKVVSKTILNCVEDARIEKKIKSKYPGLRRIYHFGYNELFKNDFFGTSKVDIDSLNLADKINLHFKIGYIEEISFSDEEKVFVEAVENVETFDDAIEVSKRIQEYVREELKSQYETLQETDESGQIGEEFSIEDFGDNFRDILGKPSAENDQKHTENDSDSTEKFGEFDEEGLLEELGYPEDFTLDEFLEQNLKSHTQEFSEENVKELYRDNGKSSVYIDIPEIGLNDYIVGHKKIFKELNEVVAKKNCIDYSNYNKFKLENNSVISYLIKEFNLKKDAKGRKKAKISKTGDINLNKLYSYKISEDIFKRSTVVSKNQSHGLVFFLDWSGSMNGILKETINQLIILVSFCRKVNIPFEVYAFSSNKMTKSHNITDNVFMLDPLQLLNLFSSFMTNSEFVEACNFLLSFDGATFSKENSNFFDRLYVPNWFSLGNTPLNHTILLSNAVMEKFKSSSKVQIVNAIYLTDGDSHGVNYYSKVSTQYSTQTSCYSLRNGRHNVYFRDKKSKEVLKFIPSYNNFQETNQCLKFVKQFCDFRTMGLRLINPRELKSYIHRNTSWEESQTKIKEFNSNNVLEIDTEFDKFFFVKTNINRSDEEIGEIDGKSSAYIARNFAKMLNKKVNTKIFLRKFVEFIS